MTKPKNIFLIARKGHEGDENQLTEMLAWLFQQEAGLLPDWLASLDLPVAGIEEWRIETQRAVLGGFLDLVVYSPGKAIVVMESKLGSTTDFAQISKYIEYAKAVPVTGVKAIVFATQHPEPWPTGVEIIAGDQVTLVIKRWQALGNFLRESESQLGHDFVAMMEKEGLVTPEAITTDDWEVWHRGNELTRRLARLITEATPAIHTLEPGYSKSRGVVLSNNGLLYDLFHFEHLSFGIGFWPTRKPSRPSDYAMLVAYVLNTTIAEAERKAAGQAAVERAATRSVEMTGWSENFVQRSTPAHEVLTAADFEGQVEQLVAHLEESLEYFRKLSYLPAPPEGEVG